jgi:hypothetical protein
VRLARWGAVLAAVVLVAGSGCTDKDDEPDASPSADDAVAPAVNEDHWHAAFGVFVCDEFLADLPTFESPVGIHTHGDGVIHIHPFSAAGAGTNATLGAFLDGAPIDLEDGALEVDGVTWHDGEECNGRPARVMLARWDDAASGGDPEIVTDDMTRIRFRADGEAYTIAFVPEGTDIPLPPSAANLAELGQADSAGPTTTGIPGTTLESEPVGEDGFYPVREAVPATETACPPGTAGADSSDGGECFTLGRGAVGMDVVDSAEADQQVGHWLVRLTLTDEGIDRFNELAAICFAGEQADCASRRVAIVVDGRVQSAPTINNPSYEADQIQISGDFSEDEAKELAEFVAG